LHTLFYSGNIRCGSNFVLTVTEKMTVLLPHVNTRG